MAIRMIIPRVFAVTIGVAMIAGGLFGLTEVAATRSIRDVARLIENDEPLTAAFLDRNELRLPRSWIDATCLPERKRAAVSFRLAATDIRMAQPPAGSLDTLEIADQALIDTLDSLERLLECAPTDGNGWFRLAITRNAAEGPSESVITALQRSFWTAPHESWVVRLRAPFVAGLIDAGLNDEGALEVMNGDERTLGLAGNS